ncbi:HAD family hydrolase [Deinococcus psychrotolerans]|uniref:HAD family hydrolase n=1 Tax=Deinococcus psychrotolerans TaxID=2489213 RepID=A0A3G8YE68_9DEIO|nr:HAD-IA family hydrolase [Deinococcus psychrotolerans]AZI43265.1 HAD family hydrolase [Deinococcus psychrotolerans]
MTAPAPTIQALIFDFDGTILDTETLEFRRWEALYRQHGRELALRDWQQGVGTWDAFDPWLGLPDAVQVRRSEVHAELHDQITADITVSELRPGVLGVLEEARAVGLRLALATSSDKVWVSRWLEQHGLLGFFEVMATRYDVTQVKPSPELYTLAVTQLGLRPEQCLAIEDSFNGATAAAAAGVRVVVVPNEVTATQAFLPTWPRLEGFTTLADLLAAGEVELPS